MPNLTNIKQYLDGFRAYEIPAGVYRAILQAGVYIYLDGDKATYIGSSARSFKRTLSHNHIARSYVESATSVLFLPCVDRHAAYELEKRLIADLYPAGNTRCKLPVCALAESMGITESRARNIANLERERPIAIESCESKSILDQSVDLDVLTEAKR